MRQIRHTRPDRCADNYASAVRRSHARPHKRCLAEQCVGLGRILVVEDFETASKMIKIRNLKYKVITLQGDVLVPGGAITGGSFRSKISNILGRKRRIAELAIQLDDVSKKKSTKQLTLTIAEEDDVIVTTNTHDVNIMNLF